MLSSEHEKTAVFKSASTPLGEQTLADQSTPNFSGDSSEKPMFERLGGIVRLLHDSLRELGYDRSLSTVASDITDVQGRLEYVTSLTAQAADKVLNAVDISMPALDGLSFQARALAKRCDQTINESDIQDNHRTLAVDTQAFSVGVVAAVEAEKARLLDIMMAQDFQDITGQLILRIVAITKNAEKELAQLLRDNAPPTPTEPLKTVVKQEATPTDLLNGPCHLGKAMAQDSVDDLLDSLGF